jgi:hypothetical protein
MGTKQLDVPRFPKPETWEDIFLALRALYSEKHDYKTVVLDTLDQAEALCWEHICKQTECASIEDVGGGWQKGYTAAVDEWRRLLAALERVSAGKKMNVLLVAHCWVRTFKNPIGEDYDRYELKLHPKAAGVIRDWSDALCFARFEDLASPSKDSKGKAKRVRGVSTGARVLHTDHQAAWDGKNRYGLPEELPLSWEDFFSAVRAGQTLDPAKLKAEITANAKQLGGDLEKKSLETLAKFGDNAVLLAQLLSRINAKLVEAAPAAETEKGKA